MATAFQINAFQFNSFQIRQFVTGADNSGKGFTGGTFSKGQWHEVRAAEAARLQAIERAKRLKAKRRREEIERAARAAREAIEAARLVEDRTFATDAAFRQLAESLNALAKARNLADTVQQSAVVLAMAEKAKAELAANDDELMTVLLLAG